MNTPNEKDIECEMARIYEERGGTEYPSDKEFAILREEAIDNLT
jgi:hypothetical protein